MFSWKKVWLKAVSRALYAGLGATAPVVIETLGRADGLSGVPWASMGDKAGLVFLIGILGGGVGGVLNWQKHKAVK
jgi:hypothetical protein